MCLYVCEYFLVWLFFSSSIFQAYRRYCFSVNFLFPRLIFTTIPWMRGFGRVIASRVRVLITWPAIMVDFRKLTMLTEGLNLCTLFCCSSVLFRKLITETKTMRGLVKIVMSPYLEFFMSISFFRKISTRFI